MKPYSLLIPFECLARRLDPAFDRFVNRIDRHTTPRAWKIGAFAEHLLAFVVGFSAGILALVWPWLVLIPAFLLSSLVDPRLWTRIYGSAAREVSYQASFLVNLDVVYLFLVGQAFGLLLT